MSRFRIPRLDETIAEDLGELSGLKVELKWNSSGLESDTLRVRIVVVESEPGNCAMRLLTGIR